MYRLYDLLYRQNWSLDKWRACLLIFWFQYIKLFFLCYFHPVQCLSLFLHSFQSPVSQEETLSWLAQRQQTVWVSAITTQCLTSVSLYLGLQGDECVTASSLECATTVLHMQWVTHTNTSIGSTERYSSVWSGMIVAPLDLACVSTADGTLSQWVGYKLDAYVLQEGTCKGALPLFSPGEKDSTCV